MAPVDVVVLAVAIIAIALMALIAGIHLGQSGVARVQRVPRAEIQLERHLRKAHKLVGDSKDDIDRVVAKAIEDMRAAARQD